MVSVLALCAIDPGRAKPMTMVFTASLIIMLHKLKGVPKSKDGLAQNQDNMSEQSDSSTVLKIQLIDLA